MLQLADTEANCKNEMVKTRIPSSVGWCFDVLCVVLGGHFSGAFARTANLSLALSPLPACSAADVTSALTEWKHRSDGRWVLALMV